VKLVPGADSIGYDAPPPASLCRHRGKDVNMRSRISPRLIAHGEHFGDIRFDANHVEAMAVEQTGDRLSSTSPTRTTCVVDNASGPSWPPGPYTRPAECAGGLRRSRSPPVVVTRKPGKLIVLDSNSGATIVTFTAPERTDRSCTTPANRRVYIAGARGTSGSFSSRPGSLPGARASIERAGRQDRHSRALPAPALCRRIPGGAARSRGYMFDVLPAA